jgi:hypothetical protein
MSKQHSTFSHESSSERNELQSGFEDFMVGHKFGRRIESSTNQNVASRTGVEPVSPP